MLNVFSFSKKALFFLIFSQVSIVFAASAFSKYKRPEKPSTDQEFMNFRIEFPFDVAKFAGRFVLYFRQPACSCGKHPRYSKLEEEDGFPIGYADDGTPFYIGFVLPEPIEGRESFYRLIPLVKNEGNGFVRDFGSVFFESCKNATMRVLWGQEVREVLCRHLEFGLAKFDYNTDGNELSSAKLKDLIESELSKYKSLPQ